MKEFVYKAEGFRRVRAKQIRLLIAIFAFAFLLGGIVPVLVDPQKLFILPFMFIITAIVGAVVLANSVSKQRTIYKSFKLIIDDTKVVVTRTGLPELAISKKEVRSITKLTNGNLVIRGKNQYYTIYVFPFVDKQGELENLLALIQPIRISKQTVNVLWPLTSVLIATAAIAMLAVTKNDLIKMASLSVLALIFAAGFFVAQTNRKLDRTTQILSWGIFIPLLVFVCYMLFG